MRPDCTDLNTDLFAFVPRIVSTAALVPYRRHRYDQNGEDLKVT